MTNTIECTLNIREADEYWRAKRMVVVDNIHKSKTSYIRRMITFKPELIRGSRKVLHQPI